MSGVRTFASTASDRCPHRHPAWRSCRSRRPAPSPVAAERRSARRRCAVALRTGWPAPPRRHPGRGVRVRRPSTRPRSGSRSPGRDGIANGITAAAVTITATRTGGHRLRDGLPGGDGCVRRRRSSTSRPGSDTANSGIVPVSAGGAIDVYANVATDLIVDVTGTFTEADDRRKRRAGSSPSPQPGCSTRERQAADRSRRAAPSRSRYRPASAPTRPPSP